MQAEYTKSPSATLPSSVPSSQSLAPSEDGARSHSSLSDREPAWNLQASIKHRLQYLSEQLRVEKASRAENSVCSLKQVFKKVNQHASAALAQDAHRLRLCHQLLQELKQGCRPKGFVLRAESSLHSWEPPPPDLSDIVRRVLLEPHSLAWQPGTSLVPEHTTWLQKMNQELRDAKEFHRGLQVAYKSLKECHLESLQVSLEFLQEERCRQASVEEQVDEHLQGHLDEIYHLRQHLAGAEEKMVYLSYESSKEIWLRALGTF
ncbi:testis-specific protein TEX28 [Talpa occidentalis]|uniref:testis-specific protein TEX28 n=1 Tax=Talpa occidentalis TaxID=50954 RepID=UPI00189085E7|nr:testis-specific protein TEX28 [Talpa occidentalis]